MTPAEILEAHGPRESMDYDVVIVGAGPAGLSAAIRLKQLAADKGAEISVVVLEKGSEPGAHILSGAVMDPRGLNELIPDWKDKGAPLNQPVTGDDVLFLTETGSRRTPDWLVPDCFHNQGNYVISLGAVTKWLGEQAEALGVEIFPGFTAAEVLYDEQGRVRGVATGNLGIGKDGQPHDGFQLGMELCGRYTLFAEGARGHLGKQLIAHYELDKGRDPQSYAIGIKELWEIPAERAQPGRVVHTAGWPMDNDTYGGGFLYHLEGNKVTLGFVTGLDYRNPWLSPFEEMQRWKTHPAIRQHLEGGKRLSYGARAITEGGFQSVPKLYFPGGALIGCSAGFVNVPRIKGSHNAMKTGMMAAEAAAAALAAGRAGDELAEYEDAYRNSWVYEDLKRVKNVKPMWSKLGLVGGLALGGLDMWMNQLFGFGLGTWKHGKPDYATLKPADQAKPIAYPKPDGVISFDRLTNVAFSGTNHEEDQKVHLQLKNAEVPIGENLPVYDEPAQRYCPAGVYEVVREEGKPPRFQINHQNCVHCKTCDIKDPSQNINWVVPQGGEGPNYPNM